MKSKKLNQQLVPLLTKASWVVNRIFVVGAFTISTPIWANDYLSSSLCMEDYKVALDQVSNRGFFKLCRESVPMVGGRKVIKYLFGGYLSSREITSEVNCIEDLSAHQLVAFLADPQSANNIAVFVQTPIGERIQPVALIGEYADAYDVSEKRNLNSRYSRVAYQIPQLIPVATDWAWIRNELQPVTFSIGLTPFLTCKP